MFIRLTPPLSLILLRRTRERTGLTPAAPYGAAAYQVTLPRGSPGCILERDADKSGRLVHREAKTRRVGELPCGSGERAWVEIP